MGGLDKAKAGVEPKDTKSITQAWLIKDIEQKIRDMFKFEATRNELNFALSGVERGEMTIQDYEDDLSVALSNWFVKDLLPEYQHRVTDLASNNPEASAELSNPPKDMNTSKHMKGGENA